MDLENSFEKIYRAYFMEVYSYVMTFVKDSEQAQEITQETFYRAVRNQNSYRREASECTWLCAIAKNLCMDSFRKRHKNESLDQEIPAIGNIENMMLDKESSCRFIRFFTVWRSLIKKYLVCVYLENCLFKISD